MGKKRKRTGFSAEQLAQFEENQRKLLERIAYYDAKAAEQSARREDAGSAGQ
jgi:hypothetical protein